MPEYRPTPGGPSDAVNQGDLIGPDDNAAVAGDDTDPPEQGESLLGGGGYGADEGTYTDQEFSPAFPMATVPGSASENGNTPVQATYDPYANLDGLFMTPQPLSVPATNGRTGAHDLLF